MPWWAHERQCEGERECEGRKCPHTQTHTHTFLFYLNKDSHRIIAPEAHHERQCEGERECEEENVLTPVCAERVSNSHSHFFILLE